MVSKPNLTLILADKPSHHSGNQQPFAGDHLPSKSNPDKTLKNKIAIWIYDLKQGRNRETLTPITIRIQNPMWIMSLQVIIRNALMSKRTSFQSQLIPSYVARTRI